jgi:hypothetical protein
VCILSGTKSLQFSGRKGFKILSISGDTGAPVFKNTIAQLPGSYFAKHAIVAELLHFIS